MTVDHLLKTTRAVRKRLDLDREVPDEVLYETGEAEKPLFCLGPDVGV